MLLYSIKIRAITYLEPEIRFIYLGENNFMNTWKNLWAKYQHFLPVPVYMIFYLSVFVFVENRPAHIHLLSSSLDSLVPFCEVFVIPYILWFVYIAIGVAYFGLIQKDRSQYWALITNLCIGMTLFLVVSLAWPNGHTLRPAVFPRDNFFTRLVAMIYRSDTSTNVLPSIHVFNSIAMHTAIARCDALKKNHPAVVRGSLILCISIVLSTMFIKQHTVIDVITAFALNYATFCLIYQPRRVSHRRKSASRLGHRRFS